MLAIVPTSISWYVYCMARNIGMKLNLAVDKIISVLDSPNSIPPKFIPGIQNSKRIHLISKCIIRVVRFYYDMCPFTSYKDVSSPCLQRFRH